MYNKVTDLVQSFELANDGGFDCVKDILHACRWNKLFNFHNIPLSYQWNILSIVNSQ